MSLIGGEMDYKRNQAKTRKMSHHFKNKTQQKKCKKFNKCNPLITRGKWTNEALEEAMDAIQNVTTSLRKANKHWNIPLTSLFNHLNGKTKSRKLGPTDMLIVNKD
jgi:hypothetical protein